jgi:hypothetical protein
LLLPNQAGPEQWKDVKFIIFDYKPNELESNMIYEDRMRKVKEKLDEVSIEKPNVTMVSMIKCKGCEHLQEEHQKVLEMAIQK